MGRPVGTPEPNGEPDENPALLFPCLCLVLGCGDDWSQRFPDYSTLNNAPAPSNPLWTFNGFRTGSPSGGRTA